MANRKKKRRSQEERDEEFAFLLSATALMFFGALMFTSYYAGVFFDRTGNRIGELICNGIFLFDLLALIAATIGIARLFFTDARDEEVSENAADAQEAPQHEDDDDEDGVFSNAEFDRHQPVGIETLDDIPTVVDPMSEEKHNLH